MDAMSGPPRAGPEVVSTCLTTSLDTITSGAGAGGGDMAGGAEPGAADDSAANGPSGAIPPQAAKVNTNAMIPSKKRLRRAGPANFSALAVHVPITPHSTGGSRVSRGPVEAEIPPLTRKCKHTSNTRPMQLRIRRTLARRDFGPGSWWKGPPDALTRRAEGLSSGNPVHQDYVTLEQPVEPVGHAHFTKNLLGVLARLGRGPTRSDGGP